MDQSSHEYVNYRRFLVYNPNIHDESLKELFIHDSSKEIYMKSPNICPFCGSNKTVGRLKIKSKSINVYFITTFICEDHLKPKNIITWDSILFLLAFFTTFFLLVLILLYGFILLLLIAFLSSCIICIASAIRTPTQEKKNREIKKSILLETFPDGFVISVKNNEWADEFKRLNPCLELKKDIEKELRVLDKLRMKYAKIQKEIGIMEIILFVLMMGSLFSSGLFNNYLSVVLYLIVQILFLFFMLFLCVLCYIYIYEIDIKMRKKRSNIYFKSIQ